MPKVFILIGFLFVYSCGIFGPRSYEWRKLPEAYYAIPPFAKYLDSLRIVIDPGHGGQGHLPNYKRGPGGLREAEVNLQVALYLKQFLETTGAEVILTRKDDSYVSLKERADIANTSDAHFMISIHHNAGQNPETNQTAIFYHKDINTSPASIDLARHIYFGLLDALHLPQLSEDGLYSDQLIYPEGFGLMRQTKVPAVLLESSYFSNPQEEKRLNKKTYNKREAYGIFIGLCRYAASGFPHTRLIKPANGFTRSKRPEIVVKIEDGLRQREGPDHQRLRIFTNSIAANLDDSAIAYDFNQAHETVTCFIDTPLSNGLHMLTVDIQNIYKNHNLPKAHEIIVASPCKHVVFNMPINRYPLTNNGFIPIDILYMDQYSLPIWEGTPIQVRSPDAHIIIADSVLQQGTGRIFAFPLKQSDDISIIASADMCSDTLNIKRDSTYLGIIQGQLYSRRDSTFISRIDIFINDSLIGKSDPYGTYTSLGYSPGVYDIRFVKKGYKPLFCIIKLDSGEISCDTLYLSAVHGGIFHHRHMIFDPGFNEKLMGGDSACFILSHILQDSLSAAGSEITTIGSMDDSLSVTERIGMVNDITTGWYLGLKRTVAKSGGAYLQVFVYPGNIMASAVADSIGAVFKQQGFRYNLTSTTQITEIRNTNKTAVGLDISAGKEITDAQLAQWIFTGLRAYYRIVEIREETRP